MRRADREVTDFGEILAIMNACDVIELALNDTDGYPYVLPMNFCLRAEDGRVSVYFHSAKDGKKLDLIDRDGRAAFCMSTGHELVLTNTACAATWKYESACGKGVICRVTDMCEKLYALTALMRKYDPAHEHVFDERHANAVTIFRLDVEALTGKRRQTK